MAPQDCDNLLMIETALLTGLRLRVDAVNSDHIIDI